MCKLARTILCRTYAFLCWQELLAMNIQVKLFDEEGHQLITLFSVVETAI